jgi:caa(3)-type oxidase subunit IV
LACTSEGGDGSNQNSTHEPGNPHLRDGLPGAPDIARRNRGVAYIDLGVFSPVAALSIAILKAVLIMLFFMHLRHSPKLTWIFALLGILWLMILFGITMADYLSRG